jgi:hypothetical protein
MVRLLKGKRDAWIEIAVLRESENPEDCGMKRRGIQTVFFNAACLWLRSLRQPIRLTHEYQKERISKKSVVTRAEQSSRPRL